LRSLGRLCGEKLLTPKITEEGRKGREEILEREEGLHCFAHKRPEASWQCKRKQMLRFAQKDKSVQEL
jgi:hypothetical protein